MPSRLAMSASRGAGDRGSVVPTPTGSPVHKASASCPDLAVTLGPQTRTRGPGCRRLVKERTHFLLCLSCSPGIQQGTQECRQSSPGDLTVRNVCWCVQSAQEKHLNGSEGPGVVMQLGSAPPTPPPNCGGWRGCVWARMPPCLQCPHLPTSDIFSYLPSQRAALCVSPAAGQRPSEGVAVPGAVRTHLSVQALLRLLYTPTQGSPNSWADLVHLLQVGPQLLLEGVEGGE